jgi:hypothetical protein
MAWMGFVTFRQDFVGDLISSSRLIIQSVLSFSEKLPISS